MQPYHKCTQASVCVCVRACVGACMRACVHACVCVVLVPFSSMERLFLSHLHISGTESE